LLSTCTWQVGDVVCEVQPESRPTVSPLEWGIGEGENPVCS
jgi:hypothetical protein